jgi:hypothetical protein
MKYGLGKWWVVVAVLIAAGAGAYSAFDGIYHDDTLTFYDQVFDLGEVKVGVQQLSQGRALLVLMMPNGTPLDARIIQSQRVEPQPVFDVRELFGKKYIVVRVNKNHGTGIWEDHELWLDGLTDKLDYPSNGCYSNSSADDMLTFRSVGPVPVEGSADLVEVSFNIRHYAPEVLWYCPEYDSIPQPPKSVEYLKAVFRLPETGEVEFMASMSTITLDQLDYLMPD